MVFQSSCVVSRTIYGTLINNIRYRKGQILYATRENRANNTIQGKASRLRGQTCSEHLSSRQNEQVEGPNLLKNNKIPAKRAGLGGKPARNNTIPAKRADQGAKPARKLQSVSISYRKRANPVPNKQKQAFCTEYGIILYGMERQTGKSMRQKHCGTAAGLIPKPATTAGSAAWSFQWLHLRLRCCQTHSFRNQACSTPHN